MGFVGAGFVIGIRMVGEWFPAKQVGLAEGVYGGWGNFGSAAAAFTLPALTLAYGGENGWRYAILTTGAFAFIYGFIYYRSVRNTPKGATYFKPKKTGGLEVSSKNDFIFLLIMTIPMYLALSLLAWKLSPSGVGLLSQTSVYIIYIILIALYAFQTSQIYLVRDPKSTPPNQLMVMKTPSVNFQDDPAYIERFLMEEWIGRRVDHPNLVKLLRTRQEPQFLYFLLEHIQGESLNTWIQNHGQQPDIQEVIRIIGEVIDGVRALHRKETLHQDIKPDNIMLDETGHVKLIDYGSCRIAAIREIEVPYERESALGTIDFSAPEYRLDIEPKNSADQFSIAMLAYHMLTGGKAPYGTKWAKASTFHDFSTLANNGTH